MGIFQQIRDGLTGDFYCYKVTGPRLIEVKNNNYINNLLEPYKERTKVLQNVSDVL